MDSENPRPFDLLMADGEALYANSPHKALRRFKKANEAALGNLQQSAALHMRGVCERLCGNPLEATINLYASINLSWDPDFIAFVKRDLGMAYLDLSFQSDNKSAMLICAIENFSESHSYFSEYKLTQPIEFFVSQWLLARTIILLGIDVGEGARLLKLAKAGLKCNQRDYDNESRDWILRGHPRFQFARLDQKSVTKVKQPYFCRMSNQSETE